jgi:choline dehydrogenase
MHTPRGKVLGGSSSINGLVYVRGNPLDFERWEQEGAAGWGYRDVLPYFRAPSGAPKAATSIAAANGKLATRYGTLPIRCTQAWLRRARRPAIRVSDDINGFSRKASGAWT